MNATKHEVRLYIDEDAAEHAVVQGLRARGLDVLTTVDANRQGSSDADQLGFAVRSGRTIYTFNVADFARLHNAYLSSSTDHCGIIVIPDQRCSIGEKVRRVAKFVRSVTEETMRNRMEYL